MNANASPLKPYSGAVAANIPVAPEDDTLVHDQENISLALDVDDTVPQAKWQPDPNLFKDMP